MLDLLDSSKTYGDVCVMTAEISMICRYPVKSLSPEQLQRTEVEIDGALPGDRRFALALGSTLFDGAKPHWLPKSSFLALVKNEKMAALETIFDDQCHDLQILRDGKQVAHGNLTDPLGRAIIEDFFSAYMKEQSRGKPRLVDAKDKSIFTDQKKKMISIINLASIRDLERVAGQPVDPTRFRANLYIDGIDPWMEFGWIGNDVVCGEAGFNIKERIGRCAAINVNPDTGERDLNLVNALHDGFGHADLGIFATVTQGGQFSVGDSLALQD